jgi:hypothetical protein
MILIACVEEKNGMMFNHRRVSRDRVVNADIRRISADGQLCMDAYSAKMFDSEDVFTISGDLLKNAEFIYEPSAGNTLKQFENSSDLFEDKMQNIQIPIYFYVEDPDQIHEEEVDKIILYRWNRSYPADQFFPIDLSTWTRTESIDFSGYSHEKITRETFVKSPE